MKQQALEQGPSIGRRSCTVANHAFLPRKQGESQESGVKRDKQCIFLIEKIGWGTQGGAGQAARCIIGTLLARNGRCFGQRRWGSRTKRLTRGTRLHHTVIPEWEMYKDTEPIHRPGMNLAVPGNRPIVAHRSGGRSMRFIRMRGLRTSVRFLAIHRRPSS